MKDIFGSKIDLSKINKKNIKIDVGCDATATNAAYWLKRDEDCFVIIIEPDPSNILELKNGLKKRRDLRKGAYSLNLNRNEILEEGQVVANYDPERLLFIPVAIDNVGNKIEKRKFFCFTGNMSACSSLHPPTTNFKAKNYIEQNSQAYEINVDCCSLEYILDQLELGEDFYISMLKTDCQENDVEVLKSLGKYIHNVGVIRSEIYTNDSYVNSKTVQENVDNIYKFLEPASFHGVFMTESDIVMANLNYDTVREDFHKYRNLVESDTIQSEIRKFFNTEIKRSFDGALNAEIQSELG